MNAVVYDGSAADRAACQRWEFRVGGASRLRWLCDACCSVPVILTQSLRLPAGSAPRGSGRRGGGVVANPYKFDVLLTTYDTMRNEVSLLGSIDWAVCVADEAHRLKAIDSFTSIALRQYRIKWLLMLTGTPVQNDLKEARCNACLCCSPRACARG